MKYYFISQDESITYVSVSSKTWVVCSGLYICQPYILCLNSYKYYLWTVVQSAAWNCRTMVSKAGSMYQMEAKMKEMMDRLAMPQTTPITTSSSQVVNFDHCCSRNSLHPLFICHFLSSLSIYLFVSVCHLSPPLCYNPAGWMHWMVNLSKLEGFIWDDYFTRDLFWTVKTFVNCLPA